MGAKEVYSCNITRRRLFFLARFSPGSVKIGVGGPSAEARANPSNRTSLPPPRRKHPLVFYRSIKKRTAARPIPISPEGNIKKNYAPAKQPPSRSDPPPPHLDDRDRHRHHHAVLSSPVSSPSIVLFATLTPPRRGSCDISARDVCPRVARVAGAEEPRRELWFSHVLSLLPFYSPPSLLKN